MKSHYESLSRVIQFTRAADIKAGPIFALQIALAGSLAPRYDELFLMVASGPWSWERILAVGITSTYLLLLSTVAWFSAMVYMPVNPKTGASLVFFADIAAMDYNDFFAQSRTTPVDDIEAQLLDQIYRVSVVASLKMSRVRWAIILSMPTVLLWLGLLVWSGVKV